MMRQLFTIGYEGTDIDRFVATLKHHAVQVVADVRAVAISRKRGFSKHALRDRLKAEGISYVHFVDLGDPKPGREAARAGRMAEFRSVYHAHLSTMPARMALADLRNLAAAEATCLLCFERDPAVCHRTIIANQLQQEDVRLLNLYGDKPADHAQCDKPSSRRHIDQGSSTAQQNLW